MASVDVDRGLPSPETYTERPVLFKLGDNGAALFGVVEYRAGMGRAPQEGDQLVLSIVSGGGKALGRNDRGDSILVDLPPTVWLEGVFNVTDVADGTIDSVFYTPTVQNDHSIWGLTIDKVRDIESEVDIDRIEKAGLLGIT